MSDRERERARARAHAHIFRPDWLYEKKPGVERTLF